MTYTCSYDYEIIELPNTGATPEYEHPGSTIGYWPEMSLDHTYIVLEPVGSARLTFGDDRYYEFMCFDVPKVVQSPGYDHGHDEESRNGRDIKIDILDDYVWTSEVFRASSSIYRSTGGLLDPPPPPGV